MVGKAHSGRNEDTLDYGGRVDDAWFGDGDAVADS